MSKHLNNARRSIENNRPLSIIKSFLSKYIKEQHLNEYNIIKPEKCSNCYGSINDESEYENCPVCNGKGYLKPNFIPLTEQELEQKLKLELKKEGIDYKYLRQREYPPIENYLDAVVKNDLEAIEEYKQECLLVKEKYPKE